MVREKEMSLFSKLNNKDYQEAQKRYGADKVSRTGHVNAYGATRSLADANKIYDYNESNRQQGVNLDNRRAANQKIVIDKNGVVDFKKTLKIRLPQSWKSILGIK